MSDSTPARATGTAERTGRLDAFEQFVRDRAEKLQAQYLVRPKPVSTAVAALAQLRRAVDSEPGAAPEIWAVTLDGLPSRYAGTDIRPSHEERAAHAALCLYAIHQQARREPMHRRDASFARAVAALGRKRDSEKAVTRRFQSLATASSFAETVTHARPLITQLRGEGLAIDYGRLALDLARLQSPATADGVRLAWGRDYYFRSPQHDDDQPPAARMTETGDEQ